MGFQAVASVIGELRNLIESRTQTKLSQLPPVTGAKPAEDSPEWSRVAFPLSLNLTALVSCIGIAARTRGNGQILKFSEPPFSHYKMESRIGPAIPVLPDSGGLNKTASLKCSPALCRGTAMIYHWVS